MQLEIRQGDILSFEGDGLVLPTISDGQMCDGLAARAKRIVGEDIERDVCNHTPIAVGAAIVTDAPRMSVRHLIHVPLVEELGMRVGIENVRRATRAGLLAALRHELANVAVPGLGYGEEGVPHDEAARAIIDELNAFKRDFPTTVALIDEDEDMIDAFRGYTKSGR